MTLLMILLLLGYRKNIRIYPNVKQSKLQSFGFDKKGNFSFNFEIPESFDSHFTLAILNITTHSQQEKDFFGNFDLCSNKTILDNSITINRTTHSFSDSIKYKTIIYPFLLRCDLEDFSDIEINLLIQYKNPFTFLDLRTYPQIKIQLIIFILFIVFFVIYMTNWVLHITFHVYLHQCLTCSIMSFLISHVLRYCELNFLDKSDDSHKLTQFHLIFVWISYFLFSFFLLLMSYGLNIITDTISTSRIINCLIISICLTFFPMLYVFYDLGPNQKYILIFIVISIIIFVIFMFINIRTSNSQLISILVKYARYLSNDLVYLIHGIYYWFIFDALLISSMITILVIVYISCPQWNTWVLELVISLTELISLSLISYLFRLRAKGMNYKNSSNEMLLTNVESSSSVNQPLLKVLAE